VDPDASALGRRREQLRAFADEADLHQVTAQQVGHAVRTVRSAERVHEHRIMRFGVRPEALAVDAQRGHDARVQRPCARIVGFVLLEP
jgi:hypothetical protein